MENKVWGMGNTRPGMGNGKFKKGTATNGGPDGLYYNSKVLPTLLFLFLDLCRVKLKMTPYLFKF